ncbi:formate/nitrite transporter family protein [Candidatus Saccharibacteria bacterium]|nr:formate/nitrite transporter family protein [Candidatus Saccharibacteria bacterium]
MKQLIKGAVLASILIGLGDYVLLKVGAPLGAFLFALGLYGVCLLGANLFTGKCGFILENKKWIDLGIILLVNMAAGWMIGWAFSMADPAIHDAAVIKFNSWDLSLGFFLRSIFCGMIMYIAVKCHKMGSIWGVFIGVPLFILAGFQHSIANVITAGAAVSWSWTILLCALGNFIGSITIAWLATIAPATKITRINSTDSKRKK